MKEHSSNQKKTVSRANANRPFFQKKSEQEPFFKPEGSGNSFFSKRASFFPPPLTINSKPIQKKEDDISEELQIKANSTFGEDFSSVSIYKNSSKAKDLRALAFTQGESVHFAPGEFNPQSQKGQELIGHEFAHVKQQRQNRVRPTIQMKDENLNDSPLLEKEADEMGKQFAASRISSEDQTLNSSPSKSMVDTDPADLNAGYIDSETMRNNRTSGSSPIQRTVDPQIDVLLTGHASPNWEHINGSTREALNQNLSEDRVANVEQLFRDIFNQKYANRGNPGYRFQHMTYNVEMEEATDSTTSSAVGSSQTIDEAGGNIRANDQSMRRVDMNTRVLVHVRGNAPSSVAVTETSTENNRSTRWAVRIQMVMSAGEGLGAGIALGSIKNLTTGQVATGTFGGGGIAGGIELPIPSASPSSSWTNFTTEEPLTFDDLDGNFARLTDLSIGIGVAGYSWAYFYIDGMDGEAVPVGGFVLNEWGAGGATLLGAWGFSNVPGPRTITEESIQTEEIPYEFTIPHEFEHTVYFPTGSAEIDEANSIQLETYADTIIGNIVTYESEYS